MRVNFTERVGVLETAIIFTKEIKWIYREQPLVDVGIDALVEESVNGNPTGKFLAIQIKSGKSNFHESTTELTLYISHVHKHYWLNLNLPIIVVAHLPEQMLTCWQKIDSTTLIETDSRWKVVIPKQKVLHLGSKLELANLVGSETNDFLSQLMDGHVSKEQVDRIISSTNKMTDLTQTLEEVAKIFNDVTECTSKYGKRLTHYTNRGFNIENRQVNNVVRALSKCLSSNSKKMHSLVLDFSSEFAEVFDAYEKFSMVYFHETQDYKGLQNTYTTVDGLTKQIKHFIDQIIELRFIVSELPVEISNIKMARKKWIDVCNLMVKEFRVSKKMSNDFVRWLYEKLF